MTRPLLLAARAATKPASHARWRRITAFLGLLLAGAAPAAHAQLGYTPSGARVIAGTYTDLGTTGTAVTMANNDDALSAAQNIGFSFVYAGQSFTQFRMSTNGFLKLGATAPSSAALFYSDPQAYAGTSVFSSTAAADNFIISPLDYDLEPGNGTGGASFRVVTAGTSPNRICTIQWKNMSDKTVGTFDKQYANLSFQAKLYEGSNRIEFVYGTFTASANTADFRGSDVGLRGATGTSILLSTKASATAWNQTTFQAGNYTSATGNRHNFRADVRPVAGLTYRFSVALPNDLAAVQIYSLGKLPIPFGTPHVVKAAIVNVGTTARTNVAVTLTVAGVTTFTNTQTIASMPSGDTAFVSFAGYTPTSVGTNTLTVSVASDADPTNNSVNWTQQVTTNQYRYADASGAAGAVGYNTGAGTILVKYNASSATAVSNVKIWLEGAATIGKTVFAVVLNGAGAIQAQTPNYVVQAADTGSYKTFTFAAPPAVTGDFFVGLAQTASTAGYFPVGTQPESPMRTGAYFAGDLAGAGPPGDFTAFGLSLRPMIEGGLTAPNACPTPTNLVVSNVTPTGATVTFGAVTGVIGYTVVYGPAGFDPATSGTSVNITTTSTTLAGLSPTARYDVYVKARCTATNASNLVGPVTFRTPCVTPTLTAPFTENFDSPSPGNLIPCGWSVINTNADTARWRVINAAAAGVTTTSPPNVARIETQAAGTAPKNDWLVSPAVTLTGGLTYVLTFQYRVGDPTTPEALEVRFGSAPTAAALTAGVQVFNAPAAAVGTFPNLATAQITPTTSGTYYIGWHAYSNAGAWRLYLDDIALAAGSACPSVTQVTASNVTGTTATISFVPGTGVNNYTIKYGLTGFNPATGGTSVSATGSPVNLTGLSGNTGYDVYVIRNCGGTAGNSNAAGPATFRTPCVAPILTPPASESFDGVTGVELPCGWSVLNLNGDTAKWHNSDLVALGLPTTSGNNGAIITWTPVGIAQDDWLITPSVQMGAGQAVTINFQYLGGDLSNNWREKLEVMVGTAPDAASLTTRIFNDVNFIYDTYHLGTGTFTAPAAGMYYFGFHIYSAANQYLVAIDDVTLTSPCAPPTLTSSGATAICPGGAVTLSASGGGTGATYQYLLNGTVIPGATGATYSATQAGTYTVRASAGACTVTSTTTVTVTISPAPTAPATTPASRCGAGTLTLLASGAPTGGSYNWYTQATGGTPIAGVTGNSYTTPSLAATTSYYVSVLNAGGCESARTAVQATITPVPTPTLTAGGATTFCTGGSVVLTASGGGTGATYQFLRNGTAIVGATGATYTANQAGTYSVQATAGTCSGTSTTTVAVTVTAAPSAVFAYATSTFCLSGTNPTPTITGATGGAFSATGGLIINTQTGAINLTSSSAGTYTVTYTLTTPCPASATQTVTLTTAPSAAFTYSATGTLCAGTSSTLTPTLATGASAGAFSAAPAGLTINPQTGAISLSTSQAGTYTVTNAIAASGSCAAASATATVTILPAATASLTAGGATTFCTGGSVVLTASSGATYQYLLNGSPISGATGATYTASQAGDYSVVVTNAAGCQATSAPVSVTVNALPTAGLTTGGATTFCAGDSVTLTATGGVSYQFTLNGTPIPGATAATYVASRAGTYGVTVTNASGCSASATTVAITVNPVQSAAFSYGAGSYCLGGTTATPTITGTTGGTFSSTTGLTLSATTGAIDLTSSTAGTYVVTYTTAGPCAATQTATLTLTAPETATFSYATTGPLCVGSTSPLLPTLSTGAVAGVFTASPTTGLVLNGATGSINVNASSPGTYIITNTVAAAGACPASTATDTVTLTAPEVATFSYAAAATLCAGSPLTLLPTLPVGAVAGAFTASPTTGLVLNGTTGEIDLNGSTAGTYIITNTVAASGPCPAVTATDTVTITAAPTATLTVGGGGTICQGDSVTLTAAGGGSYQFNINGSPLPGAINPTLHVTQSGVYTVTVTNGAGCQATSAPVTVTVNPAPAQPTITAQLQPSGIVILTSSATTGNQWYLNGVAIPGATGNTYAVTAAAQNGTYSVTSTGANGCVSPRAANELVSVTGTAALLPASAAQLVPNPTLDGWATLELAAPALAGTQLSVFDATGREVAHSLLASGATSHGLDLRALPRGIYAVRLTTPAGLLTKRLVRD